MVPNFLLQLLTASHNLLISIQLIMGQKVVPFFIPISKRLTIVVVAVSYNSGHSGICNFFNAESYILFDLCEKSLTLVMCSVRVKFNKWEFTAEILLPSLTDIHWLQWL
jgi:hypothetical protein